MATPSYLEITDEIYAQVGSLSPKDKAQVASDPRARALVLRYFEKVKQHLENALTCLTEASVDGADSCPETASHLVCVQKELENLSEMRKAYECYEGSEERK